MPKPLDTEERGRTARVLDHPVRVIKGVGPKVAKALESKGFSTVGDLLFNLPLGYLDRRGGHRISELSAGKYASFRAEALDYREVRYGRRKVFQAVFADETGRVSAKWFRFGRWLKERFAPGKTYLVSGKPVLFSGVLELHHPEVEPADREAEGRIIPRYPEVSGIAAGTFRRIMEEVVAAIVPLIPETIPQKVLDHLGLKGLRESFRETHFPTAEPPEDVLSHPFIKRLIFEELFFLELALAMSRRELKGHPGFAVLKDDRFLARVGRLLPFRLTGAQKRVMREIAGDLASSSPMNRLLQGDVGSGKTVCALLSALMVINAGRTAVLMAPTEILAFQHFYNIAPLAEELNIPLVLLTSSIPRAEKDEALGTLAEGEPALAVGTHALIQDRVSFGSLGLVVIDEQHRFGVLQRARLRLKGKERPDDPVPHVLVMTATPIPRTLAMTLYGDLDLSVIDELPPGRLPVETTILPPARRREAYELMSRELARKKRCYVVYPLVEGSEKLEMKDVTSMAEELARIFPQTEVGVLHGRLDAREKRRVMEMLRDGRVGILVATTVVEVGLDVAEATVMLIEHPERFGLAQLHQLRGRVGRAKDPSHCVLIHDGRGDAAHRLSVFASTTDGFVLAEEDLKIRGPGELAGIRQHGALDMKLSILLRDVSLLKTARRAAMALADKDPGLEKPAHRHIREILKKKTKEKLQIMHTA